MHADPIAQDHLARAHAFLRAGQNEEAEAAFHAALKCEPDFVEAHVGLAHLRLPGEGYITWLQRFHEALRPASYLEIGVAEGDTLRLAQPPTRAIGIDPAPKIGARLQGNAQIFAQTSDEFFATGKLSSLLDGKPLTLAFIDGAHVFAQALRDFMNVEPFCSQGSLVLLHDTIPLDEITQRPERQRSFYTGDVWKTALCLKHYRPDLEIFTIATPWSGLTVITGLDPTSRALSDQYDEAVRRFESIPYGDLIGHETEKLNVVPNDWGVIAERLKTRGILPVTHAAAPAQ